MSILSDYHYRFLSALLKHNVKFMVVEGQAAIYHGVRRGKGDLDILVEPTIDAVDISNLTPGIQFTEAFTNSRQVEERDIIIQLSVQNIY